MTPLRPFLNPFTMGTTPVKNIQILQRKLPKIQRKNLEKSKCNGVIRIMIFKSLRKIHWIDNSLCTLEKKFENILKDLKIWINFSNLSNYQIFQKMSKFEKFIQIFNFSEYLQPFFPGCTTKEKELSSGIDISLWFLCWHQAQPSDSLYETIIT